MNDILSEIDSFAKENSFSHWGYSELQEPLTFEIYKSWIDNQHHGKMEYLATHLPLKKDPKALSARGKSVLMFAHPYQPHPAPQEVFKSARIALYAKGQDYHFWLKAKLQKIADQLKEKFPDEEFLCFTDSGPIMERDFANQAGLGWFGKNTCLIHPKKGSLFLLGEIVTSLSFKEKIAPLPDFCGTCQKCIEICPTQAITSPQVLDARRCISYLTIESREIPSKELRPKMGDWLFGCDLCQTVCPWNQKIFKNQLSIEANLNLEENEKQNLIEDLKFILTASGKQIEKKLHLSPLKRAGPFGLRRNALVVIANKKLSELSLEVEKWKEDEKLGELATWCLSEIKAAATSPSFS